MLPNEKLLWPHKTSRGKKSFLPSKNFFCMNLAYVGKLANGARVVKFLLVRQNFCDRTSDATEMETKDSK